MSANHEIDLAEEAQFCIAVAKRYTSGSFQFYDPTELSDLVSRYSTLTQFQFQFQFQFLGEGLGKRNAS